MPAHSTWWVRRSQPEQFPQLVLERRLPLVQQLALVPVLEQAWRLRLLFP
jgi:hypothetical protein